MHTARKFASVALLLALGISAGFGWGTATHVYFANHLGVIMGPLNQNEMYGATLTDLFGYDFSGYGFISDYYLHTNKDILLGLYASASSREAKAGFYGMFTHNNINTPANVRGADWFAHGVYPDPLGDPTPDPNGWVINQGMILLGTQLAITEYIATLGIEPQYQEYFAMVVGHTLIETAGDIVLRRYMDPLVGARLILAATNRSDEIPQVLATVLSSSGLNDFDTVIAREATWRAQTLGYGQIFLLPEQQLINILSTQTAAVADTFLVKVLKMQSPPAVDPVMIANFIQLAINQIKPIYRHEILTVLEKVEKNMRNGPPPAGPIFAFWKEGAEDAELAEFTNAATAPTEFALEQNFPNPFNPTTTIAYAVPADSRVTLKIYNYLGQEIATLVNENLPAGRYTATWNASGVSSGVYFYRIESGSTILTRKMTLLK